MPAPLPPDEEERLQELFSHAVLDTGAEPEFDRITRLATRLLHVPVAFLSFVDRDRQWMKSRHGSELRETKRRDAICAHTVLSGEVLVVPDLRQDERFKDFPIVAPPHRMRFYAGAPLITPHGRRLGSLCILDTQPRHLEPDQLTLLQDLAALVMDELALRQTRLRVGAGHEADEHLDSLRDELEARIQQRTTLLINAEGRYRSIFENALEGIYQTLPDGRFLNVNPALAHLLGYATPAALTESVANAALLYVHEGRRDEFRQEMDASGQVSNWESQLYRSNGARVWVSETARVIRDADGIVLRYEGLVEDITARKLAEQAIQRANAELEERVRSRTAELALLNGTLRQQIAERDAAETAARRGESKFRALIENAQDLITILTADGTVLYQSPSVQRVLGYPAELLTGRNVFDDSHIHPDDRDAFRGLLARFAGGETSHLSHEVRFHHQDGSWRLLEGISSLLPPDSPVVGVIVNSRDITERRRAELEHQAHTRRQTALAELGRCALDGLGLQAIFDRATELVAQALEVRLTALTERTPDGAHLLIRAGTGWEEGTVGHMLVAHWRAPGSDGRRADGPVVIEDFRLDLARTLTLAVPAGEPAPTSAASVVIRGDRNEMFGTFCAMAAEPRRFTSQDVTFLQTVADLLSTIIRGKHHEAASREVETRYDRIAANTPGMVFQYLVHADGTVSLPFVSEGCRAIYGLDAAQLRAAPRTLGRVVHPEDKPGYVAALEQARVEFRAYRWEGRILLPDGTLRWVSARARPERLPNGDVIWDGIVHDVSELKRAKEEAERANAAKSEFLSRMSHELRTPLNAILGFGQLLGLEKLNPMQTSSVEQILKGGRHLLSLINEVLDITRIETGGMELNLQPVNVWSVLQAAMQFAAPLASQHGVRFVERNGGGPALAVLADQGRLHQVLLNLLSNAIKYNRPEGEVRVGAQRLGEDKIRLSVSDTGQGIEPGRQAELFVPFQRLDAPQQGIEGTGIGLAISKSLVEAMGGSIGVESFPRRGSTFFVDLPRAENPPAPEPAPRRREPEAPAPPRPPAAPGARKVLHVDDQPANVSLVERVLATRRDLSLLSAVNGWDGLTLAREYLPDLILLDLHLPDLGGDEVVRRLRADERTRHIPVVILSADATPAQAARLRQLGVRNYVTKPFGIQDLLQAIDAVLYPPPVPTPTGA